MKLQDVISENKKTGKTGVYSVCTAHETVIESALEQAKQDETIALIEATANQVNQYGGYTDMTPVDYVEFVYSLADKVGLPREHIILGGDHLGPVCWTESDSSEAMSKSKEMVRAYVKAGFKKIHLDTSMPCADDSLPLSDDVIAARAAHLCEAAEDEAIKQFGSSDLLYVIGTEVPPPGGATEELEELEVTPVNNVQETIKIHKECFDNLRLEKAWDRVIAVVVQPGVEFDNMSVIDYKPEKAQSLKAFIKDVPNVVFEAHSTDYQKDSTYKHLVNDHFAILKVGPQLTFAYREALFALSYIEEEIVPIEHQSNLRTICDEEMLENSKSWKRFYPVSPKGEKLYRQFSFSDRIRYFWAIDRVQSATNNLLSNLKNTEIPLPMISQFFPDLYQKVIDKEISTAPEELIKAKIKKVTESYAAACWKQ